MKAILTALFFTTAAAGCNAAPPTDAPPAETTPALQGTLQFSDSQMSMGAGLMSKSFNFVHLRDLWVRVTVPSLAGTSQLRLRFINPRGEVFFEDSGYYSTDPAVTTIAPPGAAQPVPVRTAGRSGTGVTLDRMIPIGGSVFQRFPEAGSWVVEAHVDGFDGTVTSPLQIATSR